MACNVRVELDPSYIRGRSREDKDRAFRGLLNTFKKRVNESGILTECKQKQTFESKAAKNRRKRRQAELERKKNKLREHFG